MTIALHAIRPEDMPVLRNVWQLYVHDFSELVPRTLNADGRFETDLEFTGITAAPLELLFIRVDEQIAGFVFLSPCSYFTGNPLVSDIAQFFVLRGYRRKGVGRVAAALSFARRPGRWEVRQMAANVAAQAFWRRAIGEATAGKFEERVEGARVVQTFVLESAP